MRSRRFRGGYQIEFPITPTSTFDVSYLGVEIHQQVRQHDTAVIRLKSKRLRWFESLSTGTPVKVVYWGQDMLKSQFIGYVTHLRPVDTDEDGRYVREVVCVAASRELRRTARATYRNKTAPEIVTAIGKRLKFNVITKQHSLRRPTTVQAGETYWEFLAKLAKRTGYVLRVEETTIFFLPVKEMVKMYASRAPVLTDYGVMTVDGLSHPNVESLEAWAGDVSDDPDNATDSAVMTAVEPSTGRVHTVKETPKSATVNGRTSRSQYEKFPQGVAVHSRKDAKSLARGAADAGMMALDATLVVRGDPLLKPYRPVEMDIRDRNLNGFWIVKSVVHRLSKNLYKSEVTVATDSFDGIKRIPGGRSKRKQRDLSVELQQGFAPDTNVRSKLAQTGTGFVKGATGPSGTTGRWVAAR